MELCVCVSILQGSGEVVCALWLSVKSSIVPFKTKELLCVQTQQAVASHSVELCWNHSNSPPNTRRHSPSHTHTNCLPVFLFVSPSLTHTNKQGAKFSRDGKPHNSTQQKQTLWTPTARREKNGAEKKESLPLRGVKLFLCYGLGWPCEDIDSLFC